MPSSHKVLVADDDRANRILLRTMLSKAGHTVLEAKNGQEAVELFASRNPDMVLMDFKMPVMDGHEATRLIKELSGEQFTPVIFLAALQDEAELAKGLDCGGDDFLTRPYNDVLLRAKINALGRLRKFYTELKSKNSQLAYHHERMIQDQEIAKNIYSNIVHAGLLESPEIDYLLLPTAIFNGDILLGARTPSGSIHILLGDFTGHGLAASIGAMPISDIFYAMTKSGFSVQDIVMEMNRKLNEVLPTGYFFAVGIMDLNLEEHIVSIWNGGIPDILIFSEDRGIRRRVSSTHLPLGIVGDDRLDRTLEIVDIAEGDAIFAYSDGLIESFNSAREMFGQKRLEAVVLGADRTENIFGRIISSLHDFQSGADQYDDITLVAIRCSRRLISSESSRSKVQRQTKSPCGWNFTLKLDADCLRSTDPLPIVIQAVTEIQGLHEHRNALYTVICELFSNALDHGLLQLDSTLKQTSRGLEFYYREKEKRLSRLEREWIEISMEHVPLKSGGKLLLNVVDSGPGFDYKNTLLSLSTCSRGIQLVEALCEEVVYCGSGNDVKAVYVW